MYGSAYDEDSLFSEPAAAGPRNSNAGAASFLLDSVVSAARSRSALVAHDEDDYSDDALAQLSRRQDALDEKTARVSASVALLTNAILSSHSRPWQPEDRPQLLPPPHSHAHRTPVAWPAWSRGTPPPVPAPRSHSNARRRHTSAGREAGMGGRLSPPPPSQPPSSRVVVAAAASASQQRRRTASPPPPVAAPPPAQPAQEAGEEGALRAAQRALEAQAAELASTKLRLQRQEELHLRYAEERASQVQHLEQWNDRLLGEMMRARLGSVSEIPQE